MVNATEFRPRYPLLPPLAVLLLTAVLLTAAAWLRSAEYDEQYTLFLTAGTARPYWPAIEFPAGAVAAVQAGHATLSGIARDLRATDVHPPLYFWAVSFWRWFFGPSLFAARMLSVLCGTISIGLVGVIANRCAIRPALAMLLTLGCYSFAYTNAIARGFAAAELLTLCGVTLLLGRRHVLAGLCLGAACCCNYLAVFVAAAVVVASGAWLAVPAAVPFLALDAWFFAAQHAARPDQFPPFAVWPSLTRLMEYQVAAVFGGLPLYVDGAWQIAAEAGLGVFAVVLVASIARVTFRSRDVAAHPGRLQTNEPEADDFSPKPLRSPHRLLLGAALAPPAGLLALGAVFNNTPVELRYLSFGLPFVALLAAASLKRPLLGVVLAVQALAITGLLLSARTMQPARMAATEAARLAGDAIILLPAGNDGVGIVGAFGIEARPMLRVLLLHHNDPTEERIAPYRRVALALIAQDRDSIAAIAAARAILIQPNWRAIAIGSNLAVYERGE